MTLRRWILLTVQNAESAARSSRLAGFLPVVRERFPGLHSLILRVRDLLVPYPSSAGVTRYQSRAIQRFCSLVIATDAGSPILEIGSDEAGAVLAELAASTGRPVIGLNPLVVRTNPRAKTHHLLQADAKSIPLASASVASILSVATLEHILALESALAECHRVLRPGGLLYADFGPIWSCSVGHHVYAHVGNEEARHWKPGKNPVPNYGHLLFTREEMRLHLKGRTSPALLEAVLEWIYDGCGINRLFFEDYVRIFRESPFELVALTPVLEHVDRRILRALRNHYPRHQEFRCRQIEVVLRKPAHAE